MKKLILMITALFMVSGLFAQNNQNLITVNNNSDEVVKIVVQISDPICVTCLRTVTVCIDPNGSANISLTGDESPTKATTFVDCSFNADFEAAMAGGPLHCIGIIRHGYALNLELDEITTNGVVNYSITIVNL